MTVSLITWMQNETWREERLSPREGEAVTATEGETNRHDRVRQQTDRK